MKKEPRKHPCDECKRGECPEKCMPLIDWQRGDRKRKARLARTGIDKYLRRK